MQSVWPADEKITVVVPAFNEEKFIGNVVRQLQECRTQGIVEDIIVVSDGSTDRTAAVARRHNAKVIALKRNGGKSRAFAVGARACRRNDSTIMLTLDADLKTIKPRQLVDLVRPLVRDRETIMAVGTVRDDLTGISGQRAIRVRGLEPLFRNSRTWRRKLFVSGYGLEVALHYMLTRQVTAETAFTTARRAEGKNLGVKEHVNATSGYLSARNGLALLLREMRREIALLPKGQRGAVRRKLLRDARDKERQRYRYSARLARRSARTDR